MEMLQHSVEMLKERQGRRQPSLPDRTVHATTRDHSKSRSDGNRCRVQSAEPFNLPVCDVHVVCTRESCVTRSVFFPKTSMGLDVFSFFCALSLSLVFLFLLLLVGVCLDIFIWHNQIEQNHSKVVFTFYCERKSLCDLLMCVFVYE